MTKRTFALLSVLATPFLVTSPAAAVPLHTVHCGTPHGSVDWNGPLEQNNTHVKELNISINVGGDDIRSGTSVSASVTFRTIWNQEKTITDALSFDPHPGNSNFFARFSLGPYIEEIVYILIPVGIDNIVLF
ncbi:hypothetical protein ACWIG5_41260, partial [Streptomyces lydicus]